MYDLVRQGTQSHGQGLYDGGGDCWRRFQRGCCQASDRDIRVGLLKEWLESLGTLRFAMEKRTTTTATDEAEER